jgi:uncharacterized membrane protein
MPGIFKGDSRKNCRGIAPIATLIALLALVGGVQALAPVRAMAFQTETCYDLETGGEIECPTDSSTGPDGSGTTDPTTGPDGSGTVAVSPGANGSSTDTGGSESGPADSGLPGGDGKDGGDQGGLFATLDSAPDSVFGNDVDNAHGNFWSEITQQQQNQRECEGADTVQQGGRVFDPCLQVNIQIVDPNRLSQNCDDFQMLAQMATQDGRDDAHLRQLQYTGCMTSLVYANQMSQCDALGQQMVDVLNKDPQADTSDIETDRLVCISREEEMRARAISYATQIFQAKHPSRRKGRRHGG